MIREDLWVHYILFSISWLPKVSARRIICENTDSQTNHNWAQQNMNYVHMSLDLL